VGAPAASQLVRRKDVDRGGRLAPRPTLLDPISTTVRYRESVPRPSNKEKLVSDGLRVVHQRGFGGASVRDIVKAAGVPQGSFTNHFVSKEAFGLEILQRYYKREHQGATLRNDSLPPLRRLRELASFRRIVCAAPSFLARNGPIDSVSALEAAPCVLRCSGPEVWTFETPEEGKSITVDGPCA
jgi:AcrR family transcriptional regulator